MEKELGNIKVCCFDIKTDSVEAKHKAYKLWIKKPQEYLQK